MRAVTTIWGLQRRRRLHAVLRQAAETDGAVDLVTGAEVTTVQPGTPGGEPAAVTWRAGAASTPPMPGWWWPPPRTG